jgi:hypothetical protein
LWEIFLQGHILMSTAGDALIRLSVNSFETVIWIRTFQLDHIDAFLIVYRRCRERLKVLLPWDYERDYSICADSTMFVSTPCTAQTACSNGNDQLGNQQKEECHCSECDWRFSTVKAFKCTIAIDGDARNLQPGEKSQTKTHTIHEI